jgi:type II secretory pathway pseudopilin PulG
VLVLLLAAALMPSFIMAQDGATGSDAESNNTNDVQQTADAQSAEDGAADSMAQLNQDNVVAQDDEDFIFPYGTEWDAPANGSHYVSGETIRYCVRFLNQPTTGTPYVETIEEKLAGAVAVRVEYGVFPTFDKTSDITSEFDGIGTSSLKAKAWNGVHTSGTGLALEQFSFVAVRYQYTVTDADVIAGSITQETKIVSDKGYGTSSTDVAVADDSSANDVQQTADAQSAEDGAADSLAQLNQDNVVAQDDEDFIFPYGTMWDAPANGSHYVPGETTRYYVVFFNQQSTGTSFVETIEEKLAGAAAVRVDYGVLPNYEIPIDITSEFNGIGTSSIKAKAWDGVHASGTGRNLDASSYIGVCYQYTVTDADVIAGSVTQETKIVSDKGYATSSTNVAVAAAVESVETTEVTSSVPSTEEFKFTINSGADAKFMIPFYSPGQFVGGPIQIQWLDGGEWEDGTSEGGVRGSFIQSPAGIYQPNTNYTITIRPKSAANEESWLGDFGFGNHSAIAHEAANKAKVISIDSAITPKMKRTSAQIDGTEAAPYGEWNGTFMGCENLVSTGSGFVGWDAITKTGSMFASAMFQDCTSLASIDGFNLPQNINEAGFQFAAMMFRGCANLTAMGDDFNLPQNVTSTVSVTGLRGNFAAQMFSDCEKLVIGAKFKFPQLAQVDFDGIHANGSVENTYPSFVYTFKGVTAPQSRTALSIINDPAATAVFPYTYYPQDYDRETFACGQAGVFSDWQDVHRNWGGRNDSWIVYDANGGSLSSLPAVQPYFSGYFEPSAAHTNDFPPHYAGETGDTILAPGTLSAVSANSNVNPTLAGYSFLGWDTSAVAITPTWQPGDQLDTSVRGETKLYAIWAADLNGGDKGNSNIDANNGANNGGANNGANNNGGASANSGNNKGGNKVVDKGGSSDSGNKNGTTGNSSGNCNASGNSGTSASGNASGNSGISASDNTVGATDTDNSGNNNASDMSFAGKVVSISSVQSGAKNIDIPARSTKRGEQAIIWDSNFGANQRFLMQDSGDGYYNIINVNSGMALDIFGAHISDAAAVIQWPLHNEANQKWAVTQVEGGSYVISSALDANYVLDINGAGSANGSTLIIYEKHGGKNQQWQFDVKEPVLASGTYVVSTACEGGRALDIEAASLQDGARMLLWDRHNAPNQQFALQFVPETGYYTMINVSSQKSVDVTASSIQSGVQVIQWASHGGLNQQWAVIASGNTVSGQPTYYIISANSGLSLDVNAGNASNNGTIIQWPLHGESNQQWIFNLA